VAIPTVSSKPTRHMVCLCEHNDRHTWNQGFVFGLNHEIKNENFLWLFLITYPFFSDRSQYCTRAASVVYSSTSLGQAMQSLESNPKDFIWMHFCNLAWLVDNLVSRPLHLLHSHKFHSFFCVPTRTQQRDPSVQSVPKLKPH